MIEVTLRADSATVTLVKWLGAEAAMLVLWARANIAIAEQLAGQDDEKCYLMLLEACMVDDALTTYIEAKREVDRVAALLEDE